jgi:hypothetical protein
MKQESSIKMPFSYLSPPAFILPLSRRLPPSSIVMVDEGGNLRDRGRMKARGESRQAGVESR